MEGGFTFKIEWGFIFKSKGHPMGETLILTVEGGGGVGGGGLQKKTVGRGKRYLLISAGISIFSLQICKFV